MWILYDPKVFMTESEYYTLSGQQISNLQEVIEEPVIYMIAPSSSSPELQIELVPDQAGYLTELSRPILSSRGNEICDTLHSFCGDTPARQFERGTQLGGTYKCGSCGCKDTMMADLPHALEKKWRSLADLQSLSKFGNIPRKLKPLDNLVVSNLREELQARHISTEGKKSLSYRQSFYKGHKGYLLY